MNQINQINKTNQINLSRVPCLAGAKNPVLYFVNRPLSAGLDERMIGTVYA
jgi:hypothetical protein